MVKAGRVTVNGQVIHHPGHPASAERDRVQLDGRTVAPPTAGCYLLLHKPAGFVSTRRDPQGRRTVMELVEPALARRVYPVGRLDRDATGLLLLTDDGDLAYRLTHPSFHVPRAYEVDVEGEPSPEALHRLATGVALEDGLTAPARLRVHRLRPQGSRLKLTLREGRKNQVKRMCATVGHPVRALRRVSYGPLHLGRMALGACRHLTPSEVAALKEAVGL
jgi:pseudouridine synthase